jgi:hypothetical protein
MVALRPFQSGGAPRYSFPVYSLRRACPFFLPAWYGTLRSRKQYRAYNERRAEEGDRRVW